MASFLLQILIGALGGNGAAWALARYGMGFLGNTIAGILGGAGGGQVLAIVNPRLAEGLGGQIAGAAFGGGALMILAGMIRKALARREAARVPRKPDGATSRRGNGRSAGRAVTGFGRSSRSGNRSWD